MDISTISLILSVFAIVASVSTFVILVRKPKETITPVENSETRQLQLQAYERLVLLAERIALPNLISRVNQPGTSVRDMQILLVENIKQEYEYNLTQQIYVSPVAWEAVRNLKEQNLLIVNQVASALPPSATGHDLNKVLLDVLMQQQKGQLHQIVLDAITYEARKLMK